MTNKTNPLKNYVEHYKNRKNKIENYSNLDVTTMFMDIFKTDDHNTREILKIFCMQCNINSRYELYEMFKKDYHESFMNYLNDKLSEEEAKEIYKIFDEAIETFNDNDYFKIGSTAEDLINFQFENFDQDSCLYHCYNEYEEVFDKEKLAQMFLDSIPNITTFEDTYYICHGVGMNK